MAKLLSPVLGYGNDYKLLQYLYDLSMFSALGGAKNAQRHIPLRVLLKGAKFSPAYWKVRHYALLDLQRQLGYPTLFITIAPYEWSFPYHEWVLDEMTKQLRERLHLAGAETLHITQVLYDIHPKTLHGGLPHPPFLPPPTPTYTRACMYIYRS